MIVVQEIRSVWTKASRGGAPAARRNSAPEAARLPAIGAGSAGDKIFHQVLLYGEANNFAGPLKSEVVELEPGLIRIGCVKIRAWPERLALAYEYDYGCGGAPARRGGPGRNSTQEVIVGRGNWARVKYNGRFSGDEWWYEKLVVNAGLFGACGADVFYSTAPACELIRTAELK